MASSPVTALTIRTELVNGYFPYPQSLDPLTPLFKHGLIAVALSAMLSLLSVTALLGFITYRMISWRRFYKEYVGYNQYIVLIYNLLLADLQQAIAFAISFHWLRIGKIVAPTAPCVIQGWMVNVGDVASGLFVLAIAIHTWLGVLKGYRVSHLWFVVVTVGIWLLSVALTLIGPIMHKGAFFARASGWCWISSDYQLERLWLHYFWVFVVEFGTIGIYGHIFFHLRGRIRGIIIHNDVSRLARATKFMIMYPLVYVILTLPIAVGRMVAMTGTEIPDAFFVVAGTLLASCGWIDALLYTLTRRVFVTDELSSVHRNHTHSDKGGVTVVTRNGVRPGDYGMTSIDIECQGNGRTVTIIGGSHRNGRGRSHNHEKHAHHETLREHSPTGSQDSIIRGQTAIGIVTETDIQVENVTPGRSSSVGSHDRVTRKA